MRTIEQITINGKSYTVTPDEQGYYTVDLSGENLDTFTIDTRSICDSGIELSNLQINEGNTRKDFVLPTASATESATGIYQSLSDLRLTLTNAERGLRQELNLSVDSIADRIEKIDTNGTKQLQQTIATVDGLRQDIQVVEANASTQLNTLKNTVNGLEQSIERVEANGKSTMASYKQTLDTLQAEFKESQQTVNGATQTKLNSLESTIDGLNQTIQSTIQNVDSVQIAANEVKETAQGLQRQITQIEQSTGKGYLSYTVDVIGAKWNPSNNAKAIGANQGISAAIYDEVKVNGAKFMRIDGDRIYPIASYSDINKTIGVDTSQYSRDFEITTGTHTYEFAPSRNGFPSGSISQHLIEQTADELRSEIKRVEQSINGLDYVTQSQLQQTADSLQSKITNLQQSADNGESLSETLLQQTTDDLRAEIRKVETTANSASSQISSVQMTVDSINRTLKSTTQTANGAQQTASQALQTTEAFQTKLDKIQENVDGGQSFSESVVQQTAEELRTQIKNAQQTANSASQAVSTLTQTVDGIDSKIQSATTSANGYTDQKLSSVNQTINGLSSSVTSLQQTVNGLDYVTQSKLTQTADSLRSEISEAQSTADGANKQISTLTQTAQGLQTSVKGLQQKQESQITQLDNLIQTQVTLDGVKSLIKQSERDIMLQVESYDLTGKEIVSRINLNPEAVRIAGKKIQIDGDTYITNATIKNSHIASLSADKLTAGTIDASKINVINLNANNISGLTSSFIQSRWNAISSSVEINPDGILSTASNGSQVYIQNGIMGARNPSGASIGQIGYQYDGGSPAYVIKTTMGAHFEVWQTANNGTTYKIIQLENGGQSYYNYASAYYFPIGEATFDHKVTISNGAELRMNEGEIVNPYGISLYHGGRLYTLSGGEATRLNGSRQLQLLVNNTRKMAIDTTRIYMYQDLNMQNHAIAQQSDARFKTNIQDYDYDALSRVDQIKFKTFNWKSSGKKDYGFIAQEVQEFAPEWIIEEPDGSLTYDTLLIAKIALRSAQQLSQKIKELEDEIKTLSGNEP